MSQAAICRHFAAAALLCCLAPGTAAAQSGASPSQAADFLRGSLNRKAVQDAVIRYSKALPGGCADIRFDPQFTVVPFAPLKFSADGKTLTGGIWKEQLRATACGTARTFNILSTARGDGTIARAPLLIGTTRADPLLQRDASVQATMAGGVQGPSSCKDISVIDTAFVDHTGPALFKGPPRRDMRPWEEKWTVHVCGTQITVLLKFVPDERGTGITATLNPRSR
jgi:hypothetical protein